MDRYFASLLAIAATITDSIIPPKPVSLAKFQAVTDVNNLQVKSSAYFASPVRTWQAIEKPVPLGRALLP